MKYSKLSPERSIFQFVIKHAFDIALIITIIIASSIIIFRNLGESSIIDWDAAIHVQVSKEVLTTGKLLPLYFRGTTWDSKPPLKIWGVALLFKYFGFSEFNARVIDAIFGVATILAIYIFARIYFGWSTGLLASFIILLSHDYIFFHGVREAVMDSEFVFFLSLALFFIYAHLKSDKNCFLYLAGVSIGLSTITKDAVGFFPVLIFPICLFYKYRCINKELIKKSLIVFICAALVYAPYFIYMFLTEDFLHFLYWDLLGRAIDPMNFNHKPIYFYPVRLFTEFKPWFVIAFFWTPFLRKKDFKDKSYVYLIIWLLATVAFFSLAHSKEIRYVFPAYPSLVILLSLIINNALKAMPKMTRIVFASALILMTIFIYEQFYDKTSRIEISASHQIANLANQNNLTLYTFKDDLMKVALQDYLYLDNIKSKINLGDANRSVLFKDEALLTLVVQDNLQDFCALNKKENLLAAKLRDDHFIVPINLNSSIFNEIICGEAK